MATQSKVNDPTEAALSAIEEALNSDPGLARSHVLMNFDVVMRK